MTELSIPIDDWKRIKGNLDNSADDFTSYSNLMSEELQIPIRFNQADQFGVDRIRLHFNTDEDKIIFQMAYL